MTIEEQKKVLFEKLQMESLCISEDNKQAVKIFEQATCGNRIAEYLKKEAWDDDRERNTKVFLIRDKHTNEIVYYFAINCGILYNEIEKVLLRDEEREPFEKYAEAVQMTQRKGLSEKELEDANNQYIEAMNKLWEVVGDADRATYLYSRAEDKAMISEEKREIFSGTEEERHTMHVQETFPAIDIKFLCRNRKYNPGIKLDFKIGVYIFWEMIVPHLLKISNLVGCKYIYLFAADNSSGEEKGIKEPLMYTQDYDPYADEDDEEKRETVLKLVDYYRNELKFTFVTKYKILKPHFERKCFTLIQQVDELESNRDIVWKSHMPVDDSSEG